MQKRALISGIAGMDGSHLADLLLEKGYAVFGIVRRSSAPNFERIAHIKDRLHLVSADLQDSTSLIGALRESHPEEIYNLAAQSFAAASWTQPVLTGDITGLGVTRMLDAMRETCPDAHFYQASSAEMFGNTSAPQNENTAIHPRSPYAVAKAYGHWITVNYRESYNLHGTSGILQNHESERRSVEFVTRKVTQGAARIKLGLANDLHLGNLDASRDWGYAPDFVSAMWQMLQQDEADDYVIGTGVAHSIRDLVRVAFEALDLRWEDYVVQDVKFMRPLELETRVGNFSKAQRVLGWTPTTSFETMIMKMVENDYDLLKAKL